MKSHWRDSSTEDCPICGAAKGEPCHAIGTGGGGRRGRPIATTHRFLIPGEPRAPR